MLWLITSLKLKSNQHVVFKTFLAYHQWRLLPNCTKFAFPRVVFWRCDQWFDCFVAKDSVREGLSNYRPTTLFNVMYKIYVNVFE
jgi:hypothetical protein